MNFKDRAKENDIVLTVKGKLFYILLKDDGNKFIAYSRWNNGLWSVYKSLSSIKFIKPGIWQFIGDSWEPRE